MYFAWIGFATVVLTSSFAFAMYDSEKHGLMKIVSGLILFITAVSLVTSCFIFGMPEWMPMSEFFNDTIKNAK